MNIICIEINLPFYKSFPFYDQPYPDLTKKVKEKFGISHFEINEKLKIFNDEYFAISDIIGQLPLPKGRGLLNSSFSSS